MKTLQIISLLALSAIAISCGPSAQEKQQQQEHQVYYEVMAVHDEAMTKMGELSRINRQLKSQLETIDSTQTQQREEISKMIENLEFADGGMMTWMAGFEKLDKLREAKTHEEIMAYLEAEKIKVNQVRDNMTASMEAGKELLNKLGATESN